MKSIFVSKTFYLALAQAVVAVVLIFQGAYPDVGWLLMAKSVVDVILRFLTAVPVGA